MTVRFLMIKLRRCPADGLSLVRRTPSVNQLLVEVSKALSSAVDLVDVLLSFGRVHIGRRDHQERRVLLAWHAPALEQRDGRLNPEHTLTERVLHNEAVDLFRPECLDDRVRSVISDQVHATGLAGLADTG